jgi:acetyltransferase
MSWSGGSAVWAADACERAGFSLPEIDPERQQRLRALLPSFASANNPVDITGASKIGLADVLSVLVDAPYLDSFILISTLHRSELLRRDFELLKRLVESAGKPVIFQSYTRPSAESKRLLRELGLPFYLSSTRAVRALRAVTDYAEFQRAPRASVSPSGVVDPGAFDSARSLTEYAGKKLLADAGFPTTREALAQSPGEAVAAARELGLPVALKLQSVDIAHKSAMGGVLLNVRTMRDVRAGFTHLMQLAGSLHPPVPVEGVLVQEMVRPGVEVIVGIENTSGFGPLLLLGIGGVHAEQIQDTTMRCAPVTILQAREMLNELRAGPILLPQRAIPLPERPISLPDAAATGSTPDVDALVQFLVNLSTWAAREPGLQELDLNPVIVHNRGQGVTIVDTFMVATSSTRSSAAD